MKTLFTLLGACAVSTIPLLAEEKKPALPTVPAAVGKVVTPDEVAKLLAEKKATVLDIRTPEEFSAGHIAGAVNIDFNGDDFAKRIAALDRDRTYVVHCAGGGRSGRSMPAFEKAKLKSVLHLQVGFKGWQAAGQPVAK